MAASRCARAVGDRRTVRALHYAMLSPTLVLLLAFLVVPGVLRRLALASRRRPTGRTRSSSASPTTRSSSATGSSGARSGTRSSSSTAIVYVEVLLGLGLAVLLSGPLPGKALVIAVILAPYAITESSGIVMWRYMFEPDVGMVSQFLGRLGMPQLDMEHEPGRDAVPRRRPSRSGITCRSRSSSCTPR